ncbi:MAG: choice-of-anchor Q domain-containing protein [Chitinophagaceae bacterium]
MKNALFFIICLTLIFTACRKDSFISSPTASVRITADTLKYDTVFTTAGSVTQSFKIINQNNRRLRLSAIELMGGNSSSFNMNVDGVATTAIENIEVEADDSIYVFVQVTVDPTTVGPSFVLRDSIRVAYNGVERFVQLEAWGQNAHFLRNTEITGNETWSNDLPYVILGYLRVNENASLDLEKGCRIYVHADAPIVVDGALRADGGKDPADHIYFQGDRLDQPYADYPASWPGIYFSETSSQNVLTYTVIKNAYQAITTVGNTGPDPKLLLNACFIDNAYDAGLIAINSSVDANNLLLTNCGKNLVISNGGDYNFNHCTIVGFSNRFIGHQYPVLSISNAGSGGTAPLNALFSNCIFWGDDGVVDDEITADKEGNGPYSLVFDHVLWRQTNNPSNSTVIALVGNTDPLFLNTDPEEGPYNFRFAEGSPAANSGKPTSLVVDIDGNPRPAGIPDLGVYEVQ